MRYFSIQLEILKEDLFAAFELVIIFVVGGVVDLVLGRKDGIAESDDVLSGDVVAVHLLQPDGNAASEHLSKLGEVKLFLLVDRVVVTESVLE